MKKTFGKTFECSRCGKRFTTREILKKHKAVEDYLNAGADRFSNKDWFMSLDWGWSGRESEKDK